MTSNYEERTQAIKHKRASQARKDYYTKCQRCNKIMGYHEWPQDNECKKIMPPHKEQAKGRIMNDKQIERARLSRD